MAATIEPKFVDPQITLDIDSTGSLTVKFKQVGIKNKVNYLLSGNATVTYLGNITKKFDVQSSLATSSSTEQIVSGTIICKLPSPQNTGARLVSQVKYENLLLRDVTNNIEIKLPSTEKKLHNATAVANTVTKVKAPVVATPAAVAPSPSPTPAKKVNKINHSGPIKVVHPPRNAGAPVPVKTTPPTVPAKVSTPPVVTPTIPAKVSAPPPVVTTTPPVAITTPISTLPSSILPAILTSAEAGAPINKIDNDPDLDDGVLTINIDNITTVKKIVLVLSK